MTDLKPDLVSEAIRRASDQIDEYVEKQAADRRRVNEQEAAWNEQERRQREQTRAVNRAAWHEHYLKLADSHAEISSRYLRQAHALYDQKED